MIVGGYCSSTARISITNLFAFRTSSTITHHRLNFEHTRTRTVLRTSLASRLFPQQILSTRVREFIGY